MSFGAYLFSTLKNASWGIFLTFPVPQIHIPQQNFILTFLKIAKVQFLGNSSKHIEMHTYSFLGLCGFSSGETKGSMAHFHFENVLRERTCKWNHLSCWPQALFPWDNRMATLLLKPLMLTLENGCPLNKPDRRHDYLKMTCCLLLG